MVRLLTDVFRRSIEAPQMPKLTTPDKNSPGYKVRRARLKLKMTQGEYADYLGIHHTFLSQIETGRRGARTVKLLKLFETECGVDPDSMMELPVFAPKKKRKKSA